MTKKAKYASTLLGPVSSPEQFYSEKVSVNHIGANDLITTKSIGNKWQ